MRVIQNFSIHHTAGPRSIGWNPEFSGGQFLNGGALTLTSLAALRFIAATLAANHRGRLSLIWRRGKVLGGKG